MVLGYIMLRIKATLDHPDKDERTICRSSFLPVVIYTRTHAHKTSEHKEVRTLKHLIQNLSITVKKETKSMNEQKLSLKKTGSGREHMMWVAADILERGTKVQPIDKYLER